MTASGRLRLVEIAELVGVPHQRTSVIVRQPGFPAPFLARSSSPARRAPTGGLTLLHPTGFEPRVNGVRIGGRTLPHGEERTPQGEVGKMRRLVLFVVLATGAALTLPQIASAAAPRCFGKKATIVGTTKADHIKGTARADVIVGLGGNDVIKGLGRGDRICGGEGSDKLIGGDRGDALVGEAGNDTLSGGGGSDGLFGGAGNDTFNGGTGFDLAS